MEAKYVLTKKQTGLSKQAPRRPALAYGCNYVTLMLVLVTGLLALSVLMSCKRRPPGQQTARDKTPPSTPDIEIGYPSLEKQKERLKKFSHLLLQQSPTDDPDAILHQIMEHVGLRNIERHLEELSQHPSFKTNPSVPVLLGRITQMKALDHAAASDFVREAKEHHKVDTLCVALYGLRSWELQAQAAEALGSLADTSAVRILAIRLFHAGSTSSGGVETRALKKQLRRSLATALERCTGLDFADYDASEARTPEVVKRCEQWLAEKNS